MSEETKMLTPEQAFDFYRHLVEENEQAIPMVAYCDPKGEVTIFALAGMLPGGMQPTLRDILHRATEKLGAPKWVLVSAESYVKMFDKEEYENGPSLQPGELQARADAGESMAECVQITGVTMDESWSYVVPFVRGAQGHVTWDEPNLLPALGGVPDVIRDALR